MAGVYLVCSARGVDEAFGSRKDQPLGACLGIFTGAVVAFKHLFVEKGMACL